MTREQISCLVDISMLLADGETFETIAKFIGYLPDRLRAFYECKEGGLDIRHGRNLELMVRRRLCS